MPTLLPGGPLHFQLKVAMGPERAPSFTCKICSGPRVGPARGPRLLHLILDGGPLNVVSGPRVGPVGAHDFRVEFWPGPRHTPFGVYNIIYSRVPAQSTPPGAPPWGPRRSNILSIVFRISSKGCGGSVGVLRAFRKTPTAPTRECQVATRTAL